MRKGKLRKSWTLFYNNYFIKPFKMTIIFSLICLFVIKFFLFIFQARSQRSFQFLILRFFFSIWVFFHEHSRFTGQQGKGEGIYLTPLYHFHPLHGGELTSAHSWQPDSNREPLVSERKSLTTKLRALNIKYQNHQATRP